MTAALFAAMKCSVRVRLLRFKGECIAALTLGRRTGRTHAADAGGSGLACLHGRITAAMSCLSTVRDAVVVCPGTGRRHRDKRKCEQRRSRGCERRRIPFHFFRPLCAFSSRSNRPQENPKARCRAEVDDPGFMRSADLDNARRLHCCNVKI